MNEMNEFFKNRANMFLTQVSKNERGLTTLKLEHALMFTLGVVLLFFADVEYPTFHPVVQVLVLIIYLTFLVGLAPLPMPVLKSKFWQMMSFGLFSALLDSFVVLNQARGMRTLEQGEDPETISSLEDNQETEGVRAKFLALGTLSAIVGGTILWFGELYAAPVYMFDRRTTAFSALYIVPPVLLFLVIISFHASRLPVTIVKKNGYQIHPRDVVEFSVGILLLLIYHNPLWCIGVLLIYAVLTSQSDHLLDVWSHHTEHSIVLVLFISLAAGWWLLENIIQPFGLDTGYGALVPSAAQSVLWGTLYVDQETYFWTKIAIISTGAMITPISSLVGVMLFKTARQWRLYMAYSLPYAALWFCLVLGWISLVKGTVLEAFLEQWAFSSSHH